MLVSEIGWDWALDNNFQSPQPSISTHQSLEISDNIFT